MKRIKLTQGKSAIVSERDYRALDQFRWIAVTDIGKKEWRAVRSVKLPDGRYTFEQMHRVVFGLERSDPRRLTHINGNTLDNRRRNLRIRSSPFGPGIRCYGENLKKPYGVVISRDYTRHFLGTFATVEEAQEARRKWLEERERDVSAEAPGADGHTEGNP